MTTAAEAAPASGDGPEQEMEALSLQQTLLDFEIANARVVDLTERLVEASGTITQLRTELQELKIQHAQLKSDHERMKSSKAFRSADRIWRLRSGLGF